MPMLRPALSLPLVLTVAVFALLLPTFRLPAQTSGSMTPNSASAQVAQLDLNTATIAELKALPGMGVTYARRIVENRPYSAKNQLVTRGILPQATYDGMRDRVVAHRPQSAR